MPRVHDVLLRLRTELADYKDPIRYALIHKAFVFGMTFAVILFFPKAFSVFAYFAHMHWPFEELPNWTSYFKTWDSAHYLALAERGYRIGEQSSAFYPLWPMLIRFQSALFFGNELLSALFLANLFSLLASCLIFATLRKLYDEKIAKRTLLLILASPPALFLCFPYSENVTLLLVALFLWGVLKKNLWLIGITTFLLPMSRPVGVLILIPLAWVVHKWARAQKKMALYLLLVPCLLGYFSYFAFMYISTGDPFEGFAAQKRFIFGANMFNVLRLDKVVHALFDVENVVRELRAFFDRAVFLLVLPGLWAVRKNRLFLLYGLVFGLVPAFSLLFNSYRRFALLVIPAFLGWALLFQQRNWSQRTYLLTLALLILIQGFFVYRFINFYWAG